MNKRNYLSKQIYLFKRKMHKYIKLTMEDCNLKAVNAIFSKNKEKDELEK